MRALVLLAGAGILACSSDDPRSRLADEDRFVRIEAVKSISNWSDRDAAVEAIEPVLRGDRDLMVRKAALEALGRLKTAKALDLLFTAAVDDAADLGVRVKAFGTIGDTGEVAVIPRVIELNRSGRLGDAAPTGARLALRRFGRRVLRPVLSALHDPCPRGAPAICDPADMRVQMMLVLGTVGDQSILGEITRYKDDPDPDVRAAVMLTVAELEVKPPPATVTPRGR